MTPRRSAPAAPRVAVLGGGIAGLAAAHFVQAARPDVEVVVFEATGSVGGKLRLAEVGGVTVDVGAESILNRRPEGVALAREVGLADDVVHPATTEARVWSRGNLHRLPRQTMGVPHDHADLAASGLLSSAGLARAALDQVRPALDIGDTDVTAGWLVEQRFGTEVVDRILEPLLGGVYAGHARELSARATIPQVVALLGHERSLAKSASDAALANPASAQPVFAGLRGGVGRLPLTLATGLGVRTGVVVRDVRRSAGGWIVETGSMNAPEVEEFDAVVVALPAPVASRVLAGSVPGASMELARIEVASMAVVTMAFAAHDFPQVSGSGFLVPPVDGRQIKAATYSTAKWDWVREADEDVFVLRVSLGRHREAEQLQRTDAEIVDLAVADLAEAIGLSVTPVDSLVTRWGGGLPQYAVGHLERVRRIRADVAAQPGLAVCGAAYSGVGIPAVIATAREAADRVLAGLLAPTSTSGGE